MAGGWLAADNTIARTSPAGLRTISARSLQTRCPMSQGFKGSTTVFADDLGDDTIEMEFTAEQQLKLSQAAEAATTVAFPAESTPSPAQALAVCTTVETSLQAGGMKQLRVRPLILIAAVVGVTAAITWRVAGHMRGPDQIQPDRIVVRLVIPPIAPPPPMSLQPQAPPVRVRNPFDVTEVFEFPAATSRTEARAAMAKMLLGRAQDRRGQGPSIGHAADRYWGRDASDKNPTAAAR